MLFNSIQFAIFLPIVFLLYWFVFDRFISKSKWQLRLQNAFVVVASYVFYGWWDWRFLLLIAFTSFCSWGSGLLIGKADSKKKAKLWMWLNIVLNLGILALFKYYDFFVSEFADLFHISTDGLLLRVILPVGISFYTFQALSYSIDVCRGKLEPTKDIVAFFAFISFFPQLVAGPIERATNLLPQFLKKREFNYEMAADGMWQILWGLFKKIVVADNCAVFVDQVFSNYAEQSGSTLLLGIVLFAFQLYCDFSGYSEIAIGTAKLFGIRLMRNFNNPYFATSFADYWKRNHISLTTWFMDYVYYPMIGSSDKLVYWNLCMIVTFLLSGMWHGAGWTFLLWGLYQGIFIVISMNTSKARRKFEKRNKLKDNKLYEVFTMIVTFFIVTIGLILFRAESIVQAWEYACGMMQFGTLRAFYRFFTLPEIRLTNLFVVIMLVVDWLQRDKQHGFEGLDKLYILRNKYLRPIFYALLLLLVLVYGGKHASFIYFQF
jgi:D-alanyl-lipoteichoic acid acyltransferase DltB (MBOAT superfamily)